jgi:hypothetical protein
MSAEVVRLYPPPPPEEFRREGLGWVYEPKDTRVVFRARHLKRSSGELWAEVEVRSNYPVGHAHLVRARYNLSIDSARVKLAAYCQKQHTALDEVDWARLVELFAVRVLDAQHRGEGVVKLGNLDEPEWQPDLIEKLIQAGQITSLYGPQGDGKGWLAVLVAVCVTAGLSYCGLRVRQAKVLYLDWEADRWTFQRRVKAICAGLGIETVDIDWYKPRGPIGQEVDYIAEYVQREGIGLVIWDSIGQAGGSPTEQGGSYEGVAMTLFEAATVMGEAVSHLWVDHLNAEGIKEKIAGKAHGAIRKMAQARVAWEVRKVQEEESDSYSVGLFHTKHNNTRKYAPLGFRLTFESDQYGRARTVTFGREDVRTTDNIERLGLPAQFEAAITRARCAIPTSRLATELGIEKNHVVNLGHKLEARGRVVSFGGGRGRGNEALWGLREAHNGQAEKTLPPSTPPSVFSFPSGKDTKDTDEKTPTVFSANGGSPTPPPGTGGRLPYADDDDLDEAPF